MSEQFKPLSDRTANDRLNGVTQSRPEYSDVFDHLVKDEDDLEGMIAYAFYKYGKKHWVISENPPDEEKKRFHRKTTPTDLDAYRARAREQLTKTFGNLEAALREEMKQEILDGTIVAKIDKSQIDTLTEMSRRSAMWRAVLSSLISTLIFAVLVFILYISIITPNFAEIWSSVVQHDPIINSH